MMVKFRHKKYDNAFSKRHNSRHRAQKLGLYHPEHDERKEILFFYLAEVLEVRTGIRHDVDHIFPLNRGGIHHHLNLQVIPKPINGSKSDSLTYKNTNILHWTDLSQDVLSMIDPKRIQVAEIERDFGLQIDNTKYGEYDLIEIATKVHNMSEETLLSKEIIKEFIWRQKVYDEQNYSKISKCPSNTRRNFLELGLDPDERKVCDHCDKEKFITSFRVLKDFSISDSCKECCCENPEIYIRIPALKLNWTQIHETICRLNDITNDGEPEPIKSNSHLTHIMEWLVNYCLFLSHTGTEEFVLDVDIAYKDMLASKVIGRDYKLLKRCLKNLLYYELLIPTKESDTPKIHHVKLDPIVSKLNRYDSRREFDDMYIEYYQLPQWIFKRNKK